MAVWSLKIYLPGTSNVDVPSAALTPSLNFGSPGDPPPVPRKDISR